MSHRVLVLMQQVRGFTGAVMASRGSVSPVEPSGRASPTTALGSAIEGLQDNTLTAIDIERRRIRDEGASALGAALLCNSSLSELIVADNGIGDEGAASLGTALEHHPTLQRLVLDKNSISDEVQSMASDLRAFGEHIHT